MSSADDLKSSAHVWGADNGSNDPSASSQSTHQEPPPDAPPAYTNTPTSPPPAPRPHRQRLNPLQQISRLSSLNFSGYTIPDATTSEDRTTTTSTHQLFHTRPEALNHLIKEQSALPPKPLVRITGSHRDGVGELKTDFDITLNLITLLDLDSAPAGSHLRIQPPPAEHSSRSNAIFKRSSQPGSLSPLQTWAKNFCTDKAENKSFDLKRIVLNLPTQTIEGQMRTLLAQLKYRGRLEITFPVQHARVVVHRQPSNWLLGLLRLYPEKKYEVVESHWGVRGAGEGENEARWTAEGWWEVWVGVVRNAVLKGRKGRVGVEEWMEWKMGIREAERSGEWGVEWVSDRMQG